MTHFKNGLNTHHFPIGTVFQLNKDVIHEPGDTGLRTVCSIVRNGIQDYILKTGVMRPGVGEEAYHISHVAHVVTRGEGPVKIDQSYNGNQVNERTRADWNTCVITQPLKDYKPRKGYIATLSVDLILMLELEKAGHPWDTPDIHKVRKAVMAQPWTKIIKVGFAHLVEFNKKRLRKFIKANFNRWLTDLAKAQKEYDTSTMEDYYEDAEKRYRDPAHLTNFDKRESKHYQQAVEETGLGFHLEVREKDETGWDGQHSLWVREDQDNRDLSMFWERLREIQGSHYAKEDAA